MNKALELVFDNANVGTLGISSDEVRHRLRDAMPDAEVKLYDLTGDGSHYQLEVQSERFVGMDRIAQHRLVNGLFRDVLGGSLHALALKTIPKIAKPAATAAASEQKDTP